MVTTGDQKWDLPLFHITGTTEGGPFKWSTGQGDFFPSLFLHGAYSDAADWIGGFDDKPFMLQLAEKGHDVWFGNNRGTKYSINKQGHERFEKEHWAFDMSDMGRYDIRSFIDEVAPIADSGDQKRVAVIAYSQGTFQMFYGLATMEDDYYGDRIHRFIAMAPCLYNNYYKWQYDETTEYYQSLHDTGNWYTEYGGYQS